MSTPASINRAEVRARAAAILEAVRADESVAKASGLRRINTASDGLDVYDADDAEALLTELSQEVEALVESERATERLRADIAAAMSCQPDDDSDLVEAVRLLRHERDQAIAERDALKRHYDAAATEHNLLALLDLYEERESAALAEVARMKPTFDAARDWHRVRLPGVTIPDEWVGTEDKLWDAIDAALTTKEPTP